MPAIPPLLIGRYGGPAAPGLLQVAPGGGERPVAHVHDASFAAWSPRHRMLYAVREQTDGALYAIAGADWRVAARVPSHGKEPCHCALHPAQGHVAIANYRSGSVAVYALDPESGLPLPDPWTYQGEGSGPDAERQEGPHAHWVGFSADGQWLLQVDLGADCVRAFAFDPARGVTGAAQVAWAAPPGSGPRWIAWASPTHALLVSELASTLTLLAFADGRFTEFDRCSTRAPGARGKNAGGHVTVAGEGARAYCTNRGDDTVALFRVEQDRLAFAQAVPSGGSSPRFLCLIEERDLLLAAHEKHGPVHAFAVAATGELTAGPETIPITKAAWLAPLP